MLLKFNKYISDNHLLRKGESVLLAVSGGIDSMAMTHLFIKSGFETAIAHCNFSLRSDESDMDEKMVAEFAAENNIEFLTIRFDTISYAKKHGLSIQMAARELRYDWFGRIRNEKGYDAIAVAHNLNDNIETLLLNLIRGTGIAGLTGMKPSADRIIRPLLFATRSEIEDYCRKNRISYREDSSNADTKYLRNRVRHQIIPLLKEINPSVESALNETAGILNGINEVVAEYVKLLRDQISENRDDCRSFKTKLINPHLTNRAVLFELFRPFNLGGDNLNDLINIINGRTGSRLITPTHIILKNRDELLISPISRPGETDIIINTPADLEKANNIESVMSSAIDGNFVVPDDSSVACLDSDMLTFPMVLRKWRKGDSFFPLGMKNRKKLSNYFTDKKYSLLEKDNCMILESAGKIVCILGERIDDRFRITQNTTHILVIKAKPQKKV